MTTTLSARAAALVTLLAVLGCDTGDSTGPQPVESPDLESLSVATPALPADGRAVTVVRAVIPLESRVVPRQVVFTTTGGAFLPKGTDSTAVTVAVDAQGTAVVLLRASGPPGLVVVRARAGAVTLQDTVRFVPAAADLASLTLAGGPAPADSVTLLRVHAVIPASSTLSPRSVTFETTLGRFSNDSARVTVAADAEGGATALLRTPAVPGLALVTARAGNSVLQDTARFFAAPPDLLSLAFEADSLQADGASTLRVRAAVRRGTGRSPGWVIFESSRGAFDEDATPATDTVPVDSAGNATALLRAATTPGTAVVRVRAGNAVLEGTVRLVRAHPELLVLSADSFRVGGSSGRTLTIRTSLRRSTGTVTPGATVMFTAVDSAGNAVGWFAGETVSDGSGQVQATYTPGTTTYRGPVRIMAHTRSASGTLIGAEMRIEVVDP